MNENEFITIEEIEKDWSDTAYIKQAIRERDEYIAKLKSQLEHMTEDRDHYQDLYWESEEVLDMLSSDEVAEARSEVRARYEKEQAEVDDDEDNKET